MSLHLQRVKFASAVDCPGEKSSGNFSYKTGPEKHIKADQHMHAIVDRGDGWIELVNAKGETRLSPKTNVVDALEEGMAAREHRLAEEKRIKADRAKGAAA